MLEVVKKPLPVKKYGASALLYFVMRGTMSMPYSRPDRVLQQLTSKRIFSIGDECDQGKFLHQDLVWYWLFMALFFTILLLRSKPLRYKPELLWSQICNGVREKTLWPPCASLEISLPHIYWDTRKTYPKVRFYMFVFVPSRVCAGLCIHVSDRGEDGSRAGTCEKILMFSLRWKKIIFRYPPKDSPKLDGELDILRK